jgi:hypothetical protein
MTLAIFYDIEKAYDTFEDVISGWTHVRCNVIGKEQEEKIHTRLEAFTTRRCNKHI